MKADLTDSPPPDDSSQASRRPTPRPLRPRTLYEDLSRERETLKQLLEGPRATAFLAHRRILDWLPETVSDRYAQAVLELRAAGTIPGNMAAYLLMPFVHGVAKARLANRPKFQELVTRMDESSVDQVIAWTSDPEASRHMSDDAWKAYRVERRWTGDYLRELGELELAAEFDDDGGDWMDTMHYGGAALYGKIISLEGARVAMAMPDGSRPTVRQFNRAMYKHLDAVDRGLEPPTFRELLDAVAAEDQGEPAG